jgi:5-histidylcysteine sulfoxide synthase
MQYFRNSWELNELLFSAIKNEEVLYQNPDPLRNPLIFYLGHTASFYVNKLKLAGLVPKGINPAYEQLFAVGVDPANAGELAFIQGWPSPEAVRAYRKQVFELVSEVIENAAMDEPIHWDHPLWGLLMGIEHARIHFETSSVLIRQYEVDEVSRPEGWEYAPSGPEGPENGFVEMAGGRVQLGKPAEIPTFGWDNEYGKREVDVKPFKAGRNLITNREFRTFVEDCGYERMELWSKEGWNWRKLDNVRHPKFWVRHENEYRYRAMFDLLPMPESWPVEVNCHEAEAYCRWFGKGARLLSESEFVFLGNNSGLGETDPGFSKNFNLNLRYGSPSPVGFLKSANGKNGITDVYGNVWTWLSNDFYPLPGFRTHPLYRDFSNLFFDDQHAMLLGGSWATTGTGASKYYRLWFRRHFFQHAGFRMATDLGV